MGQSSLAHGSPRGGAGLADRIGSTAGRWFWPMLGVCAVLTALLLALMPAEKTIGQVIKIVYLHGALSRAGLVGFFAGGVAGVAYLIWRRPWLARWSNALTLSGCLFWIAQFLVSIPATRLTWGPWIAWGEPRVTMTLQVAGAGLAVLAVTWLVSTALFTAGADALLAVAVALLADRTGVLRHPLDPIGGSPSAVLRITYLVLLVPVVLSMALVAARLAALSLANTGQNGEDAAAHQTEA